MIDKNGCLSGIGRFVYINNVIFEGQFEDDEICGFGRKIIKFGQ